MTAPQIDQLSGTPQIGPTSAINPSCDESGFGGSMDIPRVNRSQGKGFMRDTSLVSCVVAWFGSWLPEGNCIDREPLFNVMLQLGLTKELLG
jgi:hypothetical protein